MKKWILLLLIVASFFCQHFELTIEHKWTFTVNITSAAYPGFNGD